MELDLSPQMADVTITKGDGGAYCTWSNSAVPVLAEAKLGAGRLVLDPRGFALPHFADSKKIGFVVQGSCTVGLILPNSGKEYVVLIEEGDAIPVPLGSISWWYNGGDAEVIVTFLGDTSVAYTPGQITYFPLAGPIGMLGGFSTEIISRTFRISQQDAEKLAKSQPNRLIFTVDESIKMPQPPCLGGDAEIQLVYKLGDRALSSGGRKHATVTADEFPFLKEVGLSASMVKLDPNYTLAPMYTVDSSYQIIYVSKGGGRVQIVGIYGQSALDTVVQAGHLLVVPKFFAGALIAGGEGLEFFSVVTSSEPKFGEFAGGASVWKALSPAVLEATLHVTHDFVEYFKSKVEISTVVVPPEK